MAKAPPPAMKAAPPPPSDYPRVLQFRTAPGDDELDIKPAPPRRPTPSEASLEAVYSNPRFWIGAKTARTEMSYGRGEYTELDDEKGVNQRLVADGYFEITAALIAGRRVGQVPEFRAWRLRATTLAGKIVAAPIVPTRRGRPRRVTA